MCRCSIQHSTSQQAKHYVALAVYERDVAYDEAAFYDDATVYYETTVYERPALKHEAAVYEQVDSYYDTTLFKVTSKATI